MGLDKMIDAEVQEVCELHGDKMIDTRPYLIDNPEVITRFDFLPKILKRFRHMNLRHLIVVNPINHSVEGIITRQDIFTWMPL
mmetsp:Transcript_17794/g.30156  ORF Transcript_17794/g.30156 Transcript_17794/m.30156 type:complete len:83 (+) Transcript_17794:2600-2848(+)